MQPARRTVDSPDVRRTSMAALVEPHFAALMLHWTPIVLGLHPRHVREHAKDFIGIHAPDAELHVGQHDDGRAREDHVGHFAVFLRRLYPASLVFSLARQ